jgi:hypothetical protein
MKWYQWAGIAVLGAILISKSKENKTTKPRNPKAATLGDSDKPKK